MIKRYWKVMLGESNKLIRQASQCFNDDYIGIDFLDAEKLTEELISNTGKAKDEKISHGAGIACRNILTEMSINDIVVCPDGYGNYAIGEVADNYKYEIDRDEKRRLLLPHRRSVNWMLDKGIPRSKMSKILHKALTVRGGTISKIDEKYHEEICMVIDGGESTGNNFRYAWINSSPIPATEKLLGEYLKNDWAINPLASRHGLNQVQGMAPREFPTQAGKIDFLATSKNQTEYLIIELKRCESEHAVSQVLRYMEQVRTMFKVDRNKIKGCIIGHGEDDNALCALEALHEFYGSSSMDIEFYCYEIKESDDDTKTPTLKLRKVELRL